MRTKFLRLTMIRFCRMHLQVSSELAAVPRIEVSPCIIGQRTLTGGVTRKYRELTMVTLQLFLLSYRLASEDFLEAAG